MSGLRLFFRHHRRLAALLIALVLAIKALVPAGYMVSQPGKVLTIAICADSLGAKITRQIVVAHDAGPGDAAGEHGDAAAACPYAGLSMAALPGADALLVALALAYVLARGFAPVRPAARRRVPYIRPPLRGPPALA